MSYAITQVGDHASRMGQTNKAASLDSSGKLTVNGRKGNDKIELVRMPVMGKFATPMVQVKVNGQVVMTIPYAKLKSVVIHGGAGNDNIKIDPSLTVPTTIFGGKGNDTIQGGGGSDKIFGGAGNDVIDGKGGNDRIDGGKGKDTMHHYNGDRVKMGNGDITHLHLTKV